ncbi:Putative sensory transduction regulator [Corynebacterium mycetoides]|uniref:Putative sensory transduction regulator n=1 Tax=Corynebacterium mycetoides TaxID=38302 RepID=A0A1G9M423_9CORY|nr:YbjN domain-containing protein [Corynebacterium mycetoides]SDL68948.1 Putative sensory transduction regulator [Corynebacterium mycetoides]
MPTPVTQERIEALLDSLDLTHFRGESDGLTRTGFPGLVCFFQVEEAGFKITTRWLPVASAEDETAELRGVVNDLNRSLPLVRVHPVRREDGTTVVLIEAPFFTSGSLDDAQLTRMVEFYFSAIHHVKGQLEKRVPQLAAKGDAQ